MKYTLGNCTLTDYNKYLDLVLIKQLRKIKYSYRFTAFMGKMPSFFNHDLVMHSTALFCYNFVLFFENPQNAY